MGTVQPVAVPFPVSSESAVWLAPSDCMEPVRRS